MLRTLFISLALVASAIALVMGGVRGMSDGGLRHSAGLTLPDGSSLDGMSDGGLSSPLGMSDGGL